MSGKCLPFIILPLAFVVLFSLFAVKAVSAQTEVTYSVQIAFPRLSFSQPIGVYTAGDQSNRIFVVEQRGTIQVFQNSASASVASMFLNLTDRVLFGGEQGLLGLAFHPNFSENGYFFVDYVAANPTRTVIARFTANPSDIDQVDRGSELIILEINQPFSNHKGGQIAFGADGYLYIGLGDGGSEGDPLGNGQNRSTMLGKILRIDLDNPVPGQNYRVPLDNPFVSFAGFKPEIYAYGFRNPWRFSFDSATGMLWVGDVGQDRVEEIDFVKSGGNYGWNIMEGSLCYNPPTGCNRTGLELPIYEYNHTLGDAIIGGYIYRGKTLSALTGKYVFGDYGSGKIWALTLNGSKAIENTLLTISNLPISSFGEDDSGELYFCAFDGKIYKLSATAIPEFTTVSIMLVILVLTAGAIHVVKNRRLTLCSVLGL